MNAKEYIDSLKYKKSYKGINQTLNKNKDLSNLLSIRTSFLPKNSTNSERIYCVIKDIKTFPKCPHCDNKRKFIKINKGYQNTCGDKNCIDKNRILVNKKSAKKINIEKQQRKRKATMLERYGIDHNFKGELREKIYENNIKKTGFKHPLQNPNIQKKRKQSCIEKWGHDNFIHSEKVKTTMLEKYGTIHCMQNPKIRDKSALTQSKQKFLKLKEKIEDSNKEIIEITKSFAKIKCKKCGNVSTYNRTSLNFHLRNNIDICAICNPNSNNYRSKPETHIINYFIDKNIGEIQNNRKYLLDGQELDIYVPKINIGIEYNGIYWHSELFKDSKYHQNKKLLANKKGINLIHIWEDDWKYKNEIILSRLNNLINNSEKIGARKCKIEVIDSKTARSFLDKTHLRGFSLAKIHLALVYEKEIVSIMSFTDKKRVFNKVNENEWEIVRQANKLNYTIVGGFSKLLRYFINNYKPKTITSFADLDWTNIKKNVYLKNGFQFKKITKPTYFWVVDGIKSNRLNWTKQKLIKLGYDSLKTEEEIMHSLGYYRIWNSGNIKYQLEISE